MSEALMSDVFVSHLKDAIEGRLKEMATQKCSAMLAQVQESLKQEAAKLIAEICIDIVRRIECDRFGNTLQIRVAIPEGKKP